MASSTQNDFAAAAKTQLESQQAAWAALTSNTLESVRKLVELNIKVMRESMGESAAVTKQLMAAKSPQEFLSLSAAHTQPNIEKVLAYGRQVAGITSSIQSELGKAVQTQIHETSQRVTPVVQQIAKNTPAGADNAYAMMQSALENSNNGYEQWMKVTKQAAEQIEAKIADTAFGFAATAKKTVDTMKETAGNSETEATGSAKKAASPAKKAAPVKKTAVKKTASPAKKTATRKKTVK